MPYTAESGPRSDFQRDYDRIIFSSAFRRLQDKTQVFPLPGRIFVHNRLTHSLEVASLGRSLGKIVGNKLSLRHQQDFTPATHEFYKYELANVIAAACLAHDIGNPAFGHSGEKAISNYFLEHQDDMIEDRKLKSYFEEGEWSDFVEFEGNANAIRVLSHQFKGRLEGGIRLTHSTLVSIAKYPCESIRDQKDTLSKKKYGFFQSEKSRFTSIAESLGMIKEDTPYLAYKRHPFVYLVEAADDISYRVIDFEDAHRLKILSSETVEQLFIDLLTLSSYDEVTPTLAELSQIGDSNERISYLRGKVLNVLALAVTDIFIENEAAILSGNLGKPLLDLLPESMQSILNTIDSISIEKIYNHSAVVEIELAGYRVMGGLLEDFVPALIKKRKTHRDKKILSLIPQQFVTYHEQSCHYEKVQSAMDFISGMTDNYAVELFRKIRGISLAGWNK
jgi:dGTPase